MLPTNLLLILLLQLISQYLSIDQHSIAVQDFYTTVSEYLDEHPDLQPPPDDDDDNTSNTATATTSSAVTTTNNAAAAAAAEDDSKGEPSISVQIMDHIERFFTTKMYREVFCSDRTNDETEDLNIQVSERSWLACLFNVAFIYCYM